MFTFLWSILSLQSKYSIVFCVKGIEIQSCQLLSSNRTYQAIHVRICCYHGLNPPHLFLSLPLFSSHIELLSALSIHCVPSFTKAFAHAILLLLGTSFTHWLSFLFTNIHIQSGITLNPTIISFLRFAMKSSFLLAALTEHALLCSSMPNWNQYFIHSLMSTSPYNESFMKAETAPILWTTMF